MKNQVYNDHLLDIDTVAAKADALMRASWQHPDSVEGIQSYVFIHLFEYIFHVACKENTNISRIEGWDFGGDRKEF